MMFLRTLQCHLTQFGLDTQCYDNSLHCDQHRVYIDQSGHCVIIRLVSKGMSMISYSYPADLENVSQVAERIWKESNE